MLSEPLRLRLLQALMPGPAPVSELVALTGAAQSNVSNHLKALREAAMVRATRSGRHVAYAIADGDIAQLVQHLTSFAGQPPASHPPTGPLAEARTCYDHLAGRIGVTLFVDLVASGAIVAPQQAWGEVEPGPAASKVLAGLLGLDITRIAGDQGRRRFAYACPDWGAGKLHLGGALAAALLERFHVAGWLVPDRRGTRAVALTSQGCDVMAQIAAVARRNDGKISER